MKALVNGRIVLRNKIIDKGCILYQDTITAIIPGDLPAGCYSKVIDAQGQYIIPGMIDIHVHGNSGADVMDLTPDLAAIASYLAQHGVTSFLPTTMTRPWPEIERALNTIRKMSGGQPQLQSRVLGAHLEGPFICSEKRGAQLADSIIQPDFNLIEKYLDIIKIISYAPETDAGLNFTRAVVQQYPRVVLSAAHTNASYEQAKAAYQAGLKSATHIFNGMAALHHRQPGIVAAILENDSYCELIADDVHVHPVWYRILLQIKGPDRIILISDAIKATGCSDGLYYFGGQAVEVKNSTAYLVENGSLAGSTLTLNRAAANFQKQTRCSIMDIVKMVSENPANLLGVGQKYGSLEVGKIADIVVCDSDFKVSVTILGGKEVAG